MRTATLALLLTVAALASNLGQPTPAFTINRTGGTPIQLSQYKGKVVALAFILTTCPHCQALTQTLVPIAKEYAPKGVQFVECAFNQGADQLTPQFIQTFQPPFPVGWSTDSLVRGYLQYSDMDAKSLYVPHMVFIDRQGKIRGDYPGESSFFQNPDANIRAELEKLLKPAATATGSKKK